MTNATQTTTVDSNNNDDVGDDDGKKRERRRIIIWVESDELLLKLDLYTIAIAIEEVNACVTAVNTFPVPTESNQSTAT